MRSIWRTLDRGLARDIGLVCLADCLVGVSYGAIAVSSGFPLWLPMLMSLLVFAGASQFMFIGIVAAGGNPFAAVLAGLLANARHLPFGFAIGDVLGKRWPARLIGQPPDERRDGGVRAWPRTRPGAAARPTGPAGWGSSSAGTAACWPARSPGRRSATPTCSAWTPRSPRCCWRWCCRPCVTRRPGCRCWSGVVVALATTPFLPAGLPVLLALAGVLAGVAAKEPELEEAR